MGDSRRTPELTTSTPTSARETHVKTVSGLKHLETTMKNMNKNMNKGEATRNKYRKGLREWTNQVESSPCHICHCF
jgi:hypothetical protein